MTPSSSPGVFRRSGAIAHCMAVSRGFYVAEREGEGMANREAALGSAFGSPEWLALAQALDQAIESLQIEIFQVLD